MTPIDTNKKIIYVDMDDVLCDFSGMSLSIKQSNPEMRYPQGRQGFFSSLHPIPGAIETCRWLSSMPGFELMFLTAPSVLNLHCYSEKAQWILQHFGEDFLHRLIISKHKHLNNGCYLIDDNAEGCGQNLFQGKHIHFGQYPFNDWKCVRAYFEYLLPTGDNSLLSDSSLSLSFKAPAFSGIRNDDNGRWYDKIIVD